jgi:hypothetical protein
MAHILFNSPYYPPACKGLEEGIATGIPSPLVEMQKHKRGETGHDA